MDIVLKRYIDKGSLTGISLQASCQASLAQFLPEFFPVTKECQMIANMGQFYLTNFAKPSAIFE